MKHSIITLLAFILIACSPVFAQETEKSLLWEVSGNGLEQPSYIFGTIHLIPKKDYFMTDSIEAKVKECEAMTFEVDLFGMTLSEKMSLASYLVLDNTNLKKVLGEEHYNKIRQFAADSAGIKEAKFDKRFSRLTPFAVNSVLTQKYMGKTRTYEEELNKMAKKNDMKINELETADFQMSLFSKLSYEKQAEYFLDSNMTNYFNSLKELIELYKLQDIQGMYERSTQDTITDETYLTFTYDLLAGRNIKWIPLIESQMKETSTFVAVGAAHLGGEQGVLKLLEAKGYTLRAIR